MSIQSLETLVNFFDTEVPPITNLPAKAIRKGTSCSVLWYGWVISLLICNEIFFYESTFYESVYEKYGSLLADCQDYLTGMIFKNRPLCMGFFCYWETDADYDGPPYLFFKPSVEARHKILSYEWMWNHSRIEIHFCMKIFSYKSISK